MKIAICFSGEIRTGAYAAQNILRYIGNLLPNCDFFIHTWDVYSHKQWYYDSKKSVELGNTPILSKNSTYEILEKFYLAYPKQFIFSEIQNYQTWFEIFSQKKTNFSPLWYSWYKSIKLKKTYELENNFEYDYVVRIRPDLIFPKFMSLANEIYHVSTNREYFYAMGYMPERIDDVFFISSSPVMDRASEFIDKVIRKDWTTNAFGEYLSSNNIICKNTKQTWYTIYRNEALNTSSLNFNKCFNIDRDYYCPKETLDRLDETWEVS